MSTALESIHVRRMVDHAKRVTANLANNHGFKTSTPEENRKSIEAMYKRIGLDASITFAKTRIEEPLLETLPVATDGTIQTGDGTGPEVVVGNKVIEVEDINNLNVLIRVPNDIKMISVDFNLT